MLDVKMANLIFSITAKDCRWDYFCGSGKGGQKRNKTASKVRCTHIESGAVGTSDDTRSQHKNKRIAFQRMAESTKFKAWHKIETSRQLGSLKELEKRVDEMMNPIYLKVETLNG